MNIQRLIFGIFFLLGGQTLQSAVGPTADETLLQKLTKAPYSYSPDRAQRVIERKNILMQAPTNLIPLFAEKTAITQIEDEITIEEGEKKAADATERARIAAAKARLDEQVRDGRLSLASLPRHLQAILANTPPPPVKRDPRQQIREEVYKSIAPRGEDLRNLQTGISQVSRTPAGVRRAGPQVTSATTAPTSISATLRAIGNIQLVSPIANSFDIKTFSAFLRHKEPRNNLFVGDGFIDATVSNVLRTWGKNASAGKTITTPASLKDFALLYTTRAQTSDVSQLLPIIQRIDESQPLVNFESALKSITLRYADILTNNNNKRNFTAYKKSISTIIESTKPVRLNKENKILDAYVDNIITGIKSKDLIYSFIYAIAANQWNKENRSNPNVVTEEQFQQLVVNSAIAVLFQMKNGVPFTQSMQQIFGEFYLSDGTTSSSPASSSSSPSLIDF